MSRNTTRPTSYTQASTKARNTDCCSVEFVKNVLHVFNIIFFVSEHDTVGNQEPLYGQCECGPWVFCYT